MTQEDEEDIKNSNICRFCEKKKFLVNLEFTVI